MKLKELQQFLEINKDAALQIVLPTGLMVPEHFHITEIGKIHKTFIDCGGTLRESVVCSLQAWTATDIEHRLVASKLAKIIKLAGGFISEDLDVEVEYGADVASHYILTNIEVTPNGLLLMLTGKQTDCLAPDKCGVNTNKCCNKGGCC